tara:strand:+ start:708 stop:2273 length:1566 start_codon:yes stop_codon:yes gene_type:complete
MSSFQNKRHITEREVKLVRKKAEEDLLYFAKLVNPQRNYGPIHEELYAWWTRDTRKSNQLALLPRGHQKSHCAAVKAAWDITRDPSTTILYVSATAQLAEAQLYAIKQMMTSDIYRLLWPEMIKVKEAQRERWTTGEISVDHPLRKSEGVRDFTVAARGVTSNITGLHCDVIYLDDMVVPNNAYTGDGRSKVEALYSQLASIKNPGSHTTVVGTRYHPKDLYQTMLEIREDVYDDETDEKIGVEPTYDIMERVVEQQGVFLWPKAMRQDGKFFGFDRKELERIRSEYIDSAQFYAQYYNNPNDPSNARITRDKIQYYSRKHLVQQQGNWYLKDRKLNVFAAIDFAFSLTTAADYTAIVVIGVDHENNIYILDIERFKTDKIAIYFKNIVDLYLKWEFRKLRAETTVAQAAIVKELKETYIKREGLSIKIDEYRPSRHEGTKEERMAATLEPRYDNLAVWHYKGGNCNLLEDEIILAKPPHDDIKDALTAVIDIAIAPRAASRKKEKTNVIYNSRFGGIEYR